MGLKGYKVQRIQRVKGSPKTDLRPTRRSNINGTQPGQKRDTCNGQRCNNLVDMRLFKGIYVDCDLLRPIILRLICSLSSERPLPNG